ncbi:MAG: MlaD family protein [Elusimicrobiota bacterium]
MNKETRVGIFTLTGLALFGVVILVLGDVRVKRRYPLTVFFQDVEGLPDKGPVKVAGVEVGLVEKITLAGQKAKVVIRLDKDVQVHADAKAYIASTGLIGSKYMELTLGSRQAPLLSPGDTIQGEPAVSLEDIMKKVSEFFRDDAEDGNPSENLRATFANLRRVSESLNAALGQQERRLVEVVENIHAMSARGRSIAGNVDDIVRDHKDDVKVALQKIRSVSEKLDALLGRVERGEGTVGKLISDDEMGKDLKDTMTSVKKAAKDASSILGRIALIETHWDYRQRYDFEDEQYRADVGLRIQPRPEKYYFVQGNNLGAREDRKADPGADIQRKNTVTAVMGRHFGALTLYGGVIRSAGGAGVRIRPLSWLGAGPVSKRFELEAEAYDFSRDEKIQGLTLDNPVYNAGARWLLKDPWLWVGGQVEDLAERKNFNANVNLTFKDEDIAYLLGLAGLAR